MSAVVLRLDIPQLTGVSANRGHEFEGEAIRLMGLALRSFVRSDHIKAFLKCYRVVPHAVVIAADRRLNQTDIF